MTEVEREILSYGQRKLKANFASREVWKEEWKTSRLPPSTQVRFYRESLLFRKIKILALGHFTKAPRTSFAGKCGNATALAIWNTQHHYFINISNFSWLRALRMNKAKWKCGRNCLALEQNHSAKINVFITRGARHFTTRVTVVFPPRRKAIFLNQKTLIKLAFAQIITFYWSI